MEIIGLTNFIGNHRRHFEELMTVYPTGFIPDEWRFTLPRAAIRDKKCCGMENSIDLPAREKTYFHKRYTLNCVYAVYSLIPNSIPQP